MRMGRGEGHGDVTVCRSFYSKVLLALIFLVGLRVLRTLGWIPWIQCSLKGLFDRLRSLVLNIRSTLGVC